ncbi:hypothetical protein FDP41_003410 [Naegleria fowleri]|uniref:Uncharacterized protein n=1 Tax=Naegleria fowleri TaxID=5763 RepID=A0A6A5BU04_NAEFO|nr:uncharacterized protein FDP41_003410 [Naegleria fowleri]KAF0977418.1 hypothetical protein FDP41_003410 [Naegleria fowleri]CAG4717815.1 unnamed protein product [Naegleria fowleri]
MSRSYAVYSVDDYEEEENEELETKDEHSFLMNDEDYEYSIQSEEEDDDEDGTYEDEEEYDTTSAKTEPLPIETPKKQSGEGSAQQIKMTRGDLIAQLERLGYTNVPEDVVQDFIAELRNQNIEVLPEEPCTSRNSSSIFSRDDEDQVKIDNVAEEEEEENYEEENQHSDKEESLQEEQDEEAFIPVFKPPVLNDDDITTRGTPSKKQQQPYQKYESPQLHSPSGAKQYNTPKMQTDSPARNVSMQRDSPSVTEDEGYDTTAYYNNHYASLKDFQKIKSQHRDSRNLVTPKVETIKSPIRQSQQVDDYHSPPNRISREYDSPSSKIKFKPLESANYTPPSLPMSRPKTAPPVKTPPTEPQLRTPTKDTSKESPSGNRSSMVRSSVTSVSTSQSISRPLPFKTNVKKPVSYRKKVNDPVSRWRELNSVWKNDTFLKNQQNQQKSHRWRVRQEMLEIQGDKYLNPKECR